MGKLTKEENAKLIECFKRNPKIGRRMLSKATGISQKKCYAFLKKHKGTKTDSQTSIDKHGNRADAIAVRKGSPYSEEEMAELFNMDTDIWYVKRCITNSWDVTNSEGTTFTNYQTKLTWERDNTKYDLEAIKQIFLEDLKELAPEYPTVKTYKAPTSNNLLEINIRDLHLGKLCWEPESGDNYDIKIASKRAMDTLNDLLSKGLAFGFNKIVICGSDDFFNADTLSGSTSKGTPQDNDVRWMKMFAIGKQLWYDMLDTLRQYAPVDVIMVPGNHDNQRSYFLGEVLEARYHNCDNVTIDNSPQVRKYYTYGNTLLGFTHGSDIKLNDLPMIMAIEARKEWSNARFCEYHIGHLHKRKEVKWVGCDEEKGVVVRHMRSLCSNDQWHYSKGYVGTVKGAEAFIWSQDRGMTCMFESNLNL